MVTIHNSIASLDSGGFIGEEWLQRQIQHSQNGVFVVELLMYEELAQALIARNFPTNRRPSKENVLCYGESMRKSKWKANGECITLSKSGVLLDGQTRVLAYLANASTTQQVPMILLFGIEDDVFSTINTGGVRSISQRLKMAGVNYSTVAGPLARLAEKFDRGHQSIDGGSNGISQDVIFQRGQSDRKLLHAAAYIHSSRKYFAPLCNVTVFGLAYYLFREKSATSADLFMDKLKTGEELSHGDPILVVREKFRIERTEYKRSVFNRTHQLELLIKAWNHWICDEKVEDLKAVGGPFPVIKTKPRTRASPANNKVAPIKTTGRIKQTA